MPTGRAPVLLVEDDPIILDDTAEHLAENGLEVICARSAEEALALIDGGRVPSVLVTDIRLEREESGLDLATAVADRWPEVKLLIVSGACRPEAGRYPERAVFFTKPWASGALVAMIKSGDL